MILLDTNAFLWWLSDHSRFPSKVLNRLNSYSPKQPFLVSTMSVWETCRLAQSQRISLATPLETWVRDLTTLPELSFIPLDNQIVYQSSILPGIFHKDPADRIIVATALIHRATIVTSDLKIRRYKHVKSLW